MSAQAPRGERNLVSVWDLTPSPENDTLYKPVDRNDPDFRALVKSVREFGVKEALVVTSDYYIISGHRRHAAARAAGVGAVPVTVEPITHDDPRFLTLLREYNRQRVKSLDEVLREEVVSANPEDAYEALQAERLEKSRMKAEAFAIEGRKHRCLISDAKRPYLQAILDVLEASRDYWPLDDRKTHYKLLNLKPLRHANKPETYTCLCKRCRQGGYHQNRYANVKECYQDTTNMLTRGRLTGDIPWGAIADVTRPVTTWDVWDGPAPFIRKELDDFLGGYFRDLLRSQPNHIEIVGEKNTLESTIRPVAMEFCIPYTLGRGYSSLDPRKKLFERFEKSGKQKLVLLFFADWDPDGIDIPHSFARSMRDDFGVKKIVPVNVALRQEQTEGLASDPDPVKVKGARARKFRERYGDFGYEIEAVDEGTLQWWLREAVLSVLDVNAYNAEVAQEARDAAFLQATRRRAIAFLSQLPGGGNAS